jgi:hypothetical protein
MADTPNAYTKPNAGGPKAGSASDMDPPVVQPLSEADPSVAPDWDEHVHKYFNEDAHSGEALPTASHEAKE